MVSWMARTKHVPLALGLVTLLAGCGPETTIGQDWKRIEPPSAAADFTLPQLDGSPMSLSGERGRVVIMEFWATWCGPCRFSLPSLEVIFKRYRARGVSVLLINEGESADTVRAWTEQRFSAPILMDESREVGRRYRLSSLPRLFIVDQSGRLIYAHDGYGGGLERNLTLILEQLLAGSGAGANGGSR
jgi:thiol-disulfide isomerase/thioredoxin